MRYVHCLGAVAAIGFAALVLISATGLFNVAATEHHWPLTLKFIGLIRDRSIAVRAEAASPSSRQDRASVQAGFQSYQDMCVTCHAAPGRKDSAIRMGLNPRPPRLHEAHVQRRSDGELSWILQHGIRMTGMPAFGQTHSQEELQQLLAFIRYLPRLTPDEYETWVRMVPKAKGHERDAP